MYTKSIHHFFLLSQILLDVYLMYTKNVHHGNVIHTVYTICLQKVYYQCSNFGKGMLSSKFKEGTATEIPLPGKKANEVLDFLKVLYLKETEGTITCK